MILIVPFLIQPRPLSIPLWAVALILVGLLLLAIALGGLLALRLPAFAPSSQRHVGEHPFLAESSPRPDEILNALPFPAAFVHPDGQPLAVNDEATPWLETRSPPRLASPLRTLVRRIVTSHEVETAQVTLDEGQPPLRVHATPVTGHARSPGVPATAQLHGILLLTSPGDTGASLDLTRLVAHELRTPLTAIVGHSEILESCDPTDEALWRRSRDFIAAETQRLARLVDDLLALSRLEASPPLMRTVNLRTVVEGALSHLFDQAEAAGLTLTLEAPSSLPRVRADPGRLEQALVNLLDNAIKYTPAKGTVSARLTPEGGYVLVEISDTGPGILPEDLPHLFEPLYRAESVRHLPGTGLGLTIVRTILDQHGAPISVHSSSGPGATFTFRLPVARQRG
jgi:two-component system phosphate regulon sensor histidine kinase PhoR